MLGGLVFVGNGKILLTLTSCLLSGLVPLAPLQGAAETSRCWIWNSGQLQIFWRPKQDFPSWPITSVILFFLVQYSILIHGFPKGSILSRDKKTLILSQFRICRLWKSRKSRLPRPSLSTPFPFGSSKQRTRKDKFSLPLPPSPPGLYKHRGIFRFFLPFSQHVALLKVVIQKAPVGPFRVTEFIQR